MDGSLYGSAAEIIMQLPQGRAKSWHYAIGWPWELRSKVGLVDPVIYQHVKDDDTAFHAGTIGKQPASKLVQHYRATNPNEYSLGIECHGTGSVWHKKLTPTLVHLLAWLCQTHGLKANRDTIVGHHGIDAERRANCPGKNCNLLKIVDDVQHMLAQDALREAPEFRGLDVS
jgi:N-acetyl-anhydromuramyl-L-alanine amidase AmpD